MSRVKLFTRVEEPMPVDVYVPYIKASHTLQLVIDCIRAQQVQPQLVKVDDADAYWRFLKERWSEERAFAIVEHDVVTWLGSLQQLFECEKQWCTLATVCHGRMITTTLGCVRFSQQMQEQRPGFFDDIDSTWFHLDASIADKLGWPYIRPHSHWPAATHLNEVQWPDAISVRYALERKMVWQSHEEGRAIARVKFRVSGQKEERVSAATVDSEHFE